MLVEFTRAIMTFLLLMVALSSLLRIRLPVGHRAIPLARPIGVAALLAAALLHAAPTDYLVSQESQVLPACRPPVGSIMPFACPSTDPQWHLCDGSSLPARDYPELASALSGLWGNPSQITNGISLPDLRGVFLRGADSGANRDPGPRSKSLTDTTPIVSPSVGTYEQDALRTHTHDIPAPGFYERTRPEATDIVPLGDRTGGKLATPVKVNTTTTGPPTDEPSNPETRPTNAAVFFCIRIR